MSSRAARPSLLASAATMDDPEHRRRFFEAVPENARTMALWRAWAG